MIEILHADCLDALPRLAAEGFRAHAVVTDPPYHLGDIGRSIQHRQNGDGTDRTKQRNYADRGFMGQQWDGGDVAFRPETWAAVRDCMLPGAHLVAFSGTRTSHRMVCAIEDAGFEVRDTLMWVYGSGFPKSLNAERAVAMETCPLPGRHFGSSLPVPAKRLPGDHVCPATPQSEPWDGYGTALKPAYEPIILARKPLSEGTVAANVLRHGTGALNVDACRVPGGKTPAPVGQYGGSAIGPTGHSGERNGSADTLGRWPTNLLHDGSPEVEQAFAAFGERSSGAMKAGTRPIGARAIYGQDASAGYETARDTYADTGSASRFFYTAKADATDRAGSKHPTVKPASLMRWLVRLVCPEGGTILDPFAGTGSTGLAADQLGMNAVLIERDAQYVADARRKIAADAPLFANVALSEAAD